MEIKTISREIFGNKTLIGIRVNGKFTYSENTSSLLFRLAEEIHLKKNKGIMESIELATHLINNKREKVINYLNVK